MNQLLQSWLWKFIIVFFDDILIYNSSWNPHLEHLGTVFKLHRQHRFYVKKSKCAFRLEELAYLVHAISTKGIHLDPDKVVAVIEWPESNNVKKVCGFLGLTGSS